MKKMDKESKLSAEVGISQKIFSSQYMHEHKREEELLHQIMQMRR